MRLPDLPKTGGATHLSERDEWLGARAAFPLPIPIEEAADAASASTLVAAASFVGDPGEMSSNAAGPGAGIGADPLPGGGVFFRVWAPSRTSVQVVIGGGAEGGSERAVPLEPAGDGYFSVSVPEASPGDLYRYRLEGEEKLYPDPASRFQPEGPHGPSMVIDPSSFEWSDSGWRGPDPDQQVIYEMHIGTFTQEGTWDAALEQLPALADTGITTLELMPIAEFDGEFGWGYDGVDLFAPTHLYGSPDQCREFVDRAHELGLAVILDVVYNHFGPSGNYLASFSPDYFSDRYENEWGDPLNFDGLNSGPVREFFLKNAEHWIREYHLDGLRLDATQQIFDASPVHIVAEIAERVREVSSAAGRAAYLVAENEPQEAFLVRPRSAGGFGLDGLWNDDFHHSACVALTGRNEAYYSDYYGTPQELISTAKYGFLYQGQRYKWQGKRRGQPAFDVPPCRFVNFIENHDQVANSGAGARLHTRSSPGAYRAMTSFLLLSPGTPMLFQGQEFSSSAPFLYFADHDPKLAEAVRRGREEFLRQFRSLTTPEAVRQLADPSDPETFSRCKLDHSERSRHSQAYALHRDLLHLRRGDPAFGGCELRSVDGALLASEAFVLRYFGGDAGDRLVIVNLGRDLQLYPAPEPLLAPPPEGAWGILWSSERASYGGVGTAEVETEQGWIIPGQATVVLAPKLEEVESQTPESGGEGDGTADPKRREGSKS
jgi:maltooligosyltrehalose trehalohydrolase